MLFNSFVFVAFFIVVYGAYLLAHRSRRAQNVLLLGASYFFYGWWDWRFLSLLAISTVADFFIGRKLHDTEDKKSRRILVLASVAINLSILGFFKYFNFFADSAVDVLNTFGMDASYPTLKIILPVGISFYTFQTLSYTIDIYRKTLKPTKSLLDFAVFVAFFPQLVAGPIERAAKLLPQIEKPRTADAEQINAGLFLIFWGYYKKVVIADNMAIVTNEVYNNYTGIEGVDFVLASLAFTVQIYCDFSGYSDIARGLSKLMGFDLMLNFKLPYFAVNPSDFWLRWHISLSSWLRDYLYIPLGGNRGSSLFTYRNLALTMLLGGLWHGARWNFVLWGAFHGAILGLYRRFDKNPIHTDPFSHGTAKALFQMGIMFTLTVFGWVLFRCESMDQIIHILTHTNLTLSANSFGYAGKLVYFCWPLVVMQLIQYKTKDLLWAAKLRVPLQVAFYVFLMLWMFVWGVRESTEFIYFQF